MCKCVAFAEIRKWHCKLACIPCVDMRSVSGILILDCHMPLALPLRFPECSSNAACQLGSCSRLPDFRSYSSSTVTVQRRSLLDLPLKTSHPMGYIDICHEGPRLIVLVRGQGCPGHALPFSSGSAQSTNASAAPTASLTM